MKLEWIEYKGNQILYSDYSGLSESEMLQQLNEETNTILKQKEGILYLANFSDAVVSSDFMKIVNSAGKKTRPLVKKSAICGVIGMKAVLLNTFNLVSGIKAKAFDDLTKAKEYLIS